MKFNYAAAGLLSDIFYLFPTAARRDVFYNLGKIYGFKKEEVDLNEKTRQVFRNFAVYLFDLVCLDVFPREKAEALFLNIDGIENLGALKDKGALIVTAHIGNWELGGAFLTYSGYDFTAVYENHPDRNVDEFFNALRLKHNFGAVNRRDLKGIISALKDKKNIAILGDISFDSHTVPVEFLGADYNLPAGAVDLALKYKVPVVPAVCVKIGAGYRIFVCAPLKMEKTGDLKNDIRHNAVKLAKILESFILRYPEQWFVFKRFDGLPLEDMPDEK